MELNKLYNPDVSAIVNNVPSSFKTKGQEKLFSLIIQKVETLKLQLTPPLSKILSQFNSPESEINQCDVQKIKEIPFLLNKMILKTNNVFKFIEKNKKIINNLEKVSKALTITTKALVITRTSLSIGVKFIPSPPGSPGIVVSSLSDIKELQDKLVPKLEKILIGVDLLTFSLSIAYATLLVIIEFLKNLTKSYNDLLEKCSKSTPDFSLNIKNIESIISLDPGLEELEKIQKDVDNSLNGGNTYKGFILDVIQEPFSPTVNRNIGIAKNSQGIVLLKTLPSFTTIPQLLIEELKLIIDRDNLYSI